MGIELQPVRFLDLDQVEAILKSYMYGLARMLYEGADDKKGEDFVGRSRLAEKKRILLQSGILIPYLLWVYGMENVSRVFRVHLSVSPYSHPSDSALRCRRHRRDQGDDQAGVHRQDADRPADASDPGDGLRGSRASKTRTIGTAVHREAEELFWALRPLTGIYRRGHPQAHHPGEAGDGGDRTQALPGANPDLRPLVQRSGQTPPPRSVGEVDQLVAGGVAAPSVRWVFPPRCSRMPPAESSPDGRARRVFGGMRRPRGSEPVPRPSPIPGRSASRLEPWERLS